MQQPLSEPVPPQPHWWIVGIVIVVAIALYFGWQVEGPTIPTSVVAQPRPFSGVVLKISGPERLLTAMRPQLRSWSEETGAKLQIVPSTDTADIRLIESPELGALATNQQLRPLPVEYQSPQHPVQWNRIGLSFRLELCQWGGTVYGVPLSADTRVLAVRADLLNDLQHVQAFAKKFAGRRLGLSALSTWEECLDVLEYFSTVPGKPGLPPVAEERPELLREFLQIAACYDRLATADALELRGNQGFFFDPTNWQPRLTAGPFVAAADWLAQAAKYRSARPNKPAESLTSLLDGRAMMAVLTPRQVGQLPRDATGEVDSRFVMTRLPGTRSWFSGTGQRTQSNQVNYVPYLGQDVALGVVSRTIDASAEPAAWSLLTRLTEAATHAELLGDPQAGFGPIRDDQLGNNDRDSVWLNYGFDADRSAKLADAFRHYSSRTVSRPVLALRSPDQKKLLAELEGPIRQIATGQTVPLDGLKSAQLAWEKLISAQNAAEVLRWRQSDSGVR